MILLLLLLGCLLWPLFKVAYKIYQIKRQFNDLYKRSGASSAGAQAYASSQGYEPPRRQRRIDPSIATSIDFEEIEVDTNAETARQYRYSEVEFVRQQQIQDIEWEEID